jgi:hypothetical protein
LTAQHLADIAAAVPGATHDLPMVSPSIGQSNGDAISPFPTEVSRCRRQ